MKHFLFFTLYLFVSSTIAHAQSKNLTTSNHNNANALIVSKQEQEELLPVIQEIKNQQSLFLNTRHFLLNSQRNYTISIQPYFLESEITLTPSIIRQQIKDLNKKANESIKEENACALLNQALDLAHAYTVVELETRDTLIRTILHALSERDCHALSLQEQAQLELLSRNNLDTKEFIELNKNNHKYFKLLTQIKESKEVAVFIQSKSSQTFAMSINASPFKIITQPIKLKPGIHEIIAKSEHTGFLYRLVIPFTPPPSITLEIEPEHESAIAITPKGVFLRSTYESLSRNQAQFIAQIAQIQQIWFITQKTTPTPLILSNKEQSHFEIQTTIYTQDNIQKNVFKTQTLSIKHKGNKAELPSLLMQEYQRHTVFSQTPPISLHPNIISSTEPIYKKWWFWTIIGGVAASAMTTGLVLGLPDHNHYNVQITMTQSPSELKN